MLLLTVFDQISGSRRSMLLFLTTEKGPRAAKISWRAKLWPCLLYGITWLKECVCDWTYECDDRQVELAQVDPEEEVDFAVVHVRGAGQ